MSRNHYTLRCLQCNRTYEDSSAGFLLECAEKHEPALLRAEYFRNRIAFHDENPGLFRYSDWLPVRRILKGAQGPIVYRSEALSRYLRLDNLSIAFNGYWPERDAFFETASFKELEAYAVCARVPAGERRTMVVSSAGNTGMAFLKVCSENEIPALVLVPEKALPNLWLAAEKHPCVILAALAGDVDYFDAIEVAQRIGALEDFYPEGGAANVARRDGMGTVLLSSAELFGRIPDHYVQAVGSGTGGIAAWEMGLRLLADGRFGSGGLKLHFVQNAPFTIMTDAWERDRRELVHESEEGARDRVNQLYASVLSNRVPPYSVRGGVYDALRGSGGFMYSATEREARAAGALFERLEGIDLNPAAEVAVAGLLKARSAGRIGRKELVVLNITGGGSKRLELEGRKRALTPDITLYREDDVEKVMMAVLGAKELS